MHYKLFFSGEPGNMSASLYHEGLATKTVATVTGLKDEKAIVKWAKGQAALHKTENQPAETSSKHVSISGHQTFNL